MGLPRCGTGRVYRQDAVSGEALLTRMNTVDSGLTERVFRGSSILIEPFLYLFPLLADLLADVKVLKGSLRLLLAGVFVLDVKCILTMRNLNCDGTF